MQNDQNTLIQTEISDADSLLQARVASLSWMRLTLYKRDPSNQAIFRLGTLYGKDPMILGRQFAHTAIKQYAASLQTPLIVQREQFEFRMMISERHHLLGTFQIPGNFNRRSIAQAFGSFLRAAQQALTERANGPKTYLH